MTTMNYKVNRNGHVMRNVLVGFWGASQMTKWNPNTEVLSIVCDDDTVVAKIRRIMKRNETYGLVKEI